ncbi:MAG: 3-dehydroquinate synthase II [Methanotrichaceae archaeon]|nr:3-dehydroquinate synthase II [Methanotrichaceae archaeon]
MKEKWLMACDGSWEEIKPLITTALESGFDCVVVDRSHVDLVRELGEIRVACFGSSRGSEDILIIGQKARAASSLPADLNTSAEIGLAKTIDGPVAGFLEIRSKSDEMLAVELGRHLDYLLVSAADWKIIPLENMIAGLQGSNVKIISCVGSMDEVEVALTTLEKGADGVLLETVDPSEIKKVQGIVERSEMDRLKLSTGSILEVKPVGMGDRVCVDTCSLMTTGEGMLVGSQSRAFFLIQSESEESPYVAARPFRVNAGAVHAYVRVGKKTRYLSELKGGDEVTLVNGGGESRTAIVGRVKIEKRPMMLVTAEVEGQNVSTLLQNAETIKLVGEDGSISITDLKPGDRVKLYLEGGGRHFGMSIDESIIER